MTESYLSELLKIQARQLEARIAELHEDLSRRIEEMRALQDQFAGAVLARLDAHEEYHRSNEHRWGLVKLAARHPFRFAALAAFTAVLLLAVADSVSLSVLEKALTLIGPLLR